MKAKGKYERLLLISDAIMFFVGFTALTFGLAMRFKPWAVIKMDLSEQVHHFTQACRFKDLDLCPVSKDLSKFNLRPWTLEISKSIIIMGFFKVLHSVLGVVGVILNKDNLLWMMNLVVALSISCDYEMMYVITNNHDRLSWFYKDNNGQLVEEMLRNYRLTGKPENTFTRGLNLIMLTLGCCGVTGPGDMPDSFIVRDRDNSTHELACPPACCDFDTLEEEHSHHMPFIGDPEATDKQQMARLRYCFKAMKAFRKTRIPSHSIVVEGCVEKAYSAVFEVYGALVMWGLMILVMYQSLQVIFALMTCFKITSTNKLLFHQSKTTGQSATEEIAVDAQSKVQSGHAVRFDMQMSESVASTEVRTVSEGLSIPFSVKSSYVSSDTARTNSTTIW